MASYTNSYDSGYVIIYTSGGSGYWVSSDSMITIEDGYINICSGGQCQRVVVTDGEIVSSGSAWTNYTCRQVIALEDWDDDYCYTDSPTVLSALESLEDETEGESESESESESSSVNVITFSTYTTHFRTETDYLDMTEEGYYYSPDIYLSLDDNNMEIDTDELTLTTTTDVTMCLMLNHLIDDNFYLQRMSFIGTSIQALILLSLCVPRLKILGRRLTNRKTTDKE